jgi:toxin CptA
MTSAPAIGFEYRPSRLLVRLRVLITLLAVVAVLLCGLFFWLKAVLILLVAACWLYAVRQSNSTVTAAGWASDGAWSLHRADGADLPASLASFRVWGEFVLLRLVTAERGVTVLLLGPDNSDADIRRRLRMRLAAMPSDEPVSKSLSKVSY